MEKQLEILDLADAVRELVGECELTGRRTFFRRGERDVAVLISHDEYLALRETLALVNAEELWRRVSAAEADLARNAVVAPEDLPDE